MRNCNLEKVPKILKMGKEACDWQNAVGLNIPFEYDGLKDSFKIVDFESRDKVYVIYKGKKYMLYGKYIKKGKIAKLFGQTIEWQYSEGDIIKDHIESHDRNLLITARKYIKVNKNPNNRNHKYYQYKCLNCGYDCTIDDFWANESELKDGKGCGCCAGTKVVVGINDISTTLPWAIPYIDDNNYIYTHTKNSSKKTDMTCPFCGFKKKISASKLYYQSFGCPKCSDGFSYPEKFFLNILEQIGINYKTQLNKSDFKWCDKYRYDFYLPEYNCIIETNGAQHYENGWYKIELQRKIDKRKKDLALQNGIKYYIELDCSQSDKNYIKHSIITSNIPFDVSYIDYDKADLMAQKNILIAICKLYKDNPNMTLVNIANQYHIHVGTVVRYLRKGRELGLCEYREPLKGNYKKDK